jgi:hypothetical protein
VLAEPLAFLEREALVVAVGGGDGLPVVLEVTAEAVAAFELDVALLHLLQE